VVNFKRWSVYCRRGRILGHETKLYRVISDLIHEQRRLINSPHLAERFGVLWIAATLDKRLRQCTDREIGELLAIARDRFHIFEPEFAICHHAKRRLLLRP
jgi:hypothetical protein